MCDFRPLIECVALLVGVHIVGVAFFLLWAVLNVMWGP